MPATLTDLLRARAQAHPDQRGDTLALLQYTTGSTAAPMGVMLSHANLLHNSAPIAHALGHTPARRGVIWLPLMKLLEQPRGRIQVADRQRAALRRQQARAQQMRQKRS